MEQKLINNRDLNYYPDWETSIINMWCHHQNTAVKSKQTLQIRIDIKSTLNQIFRHLRIRHPIDITFSTSELLKMKRNTPATSYKYKTFQFDK